MQEDYREFQASQGYIIIIRLLKVMKQILAQKIKQRKKKKEGQAQ